MIKKGLLADKLYIPVKSVDGLLYNTIVKTFTHEIKVYVSPGLCQSCYREHEGEAPCEEDKNGCPYKTKKLLTYDKCKFNSGNFVGLWRGNLVLLKKILKGFKVRDHRAIPKVDKPLIFKGKLRKYQIEAVKDWLKFDGGGQIEAPARSGKTVVGCYLASVLKLKTLILTHQIDLLEQFYDTFLQFTDFREGEKRPRVILSRKGNILEAASRAEVVLSTYQTFISKQGQKRLSKLRNFFGLVVVDECHLVGATCFSEVVSSLNPRFFLGLTATPDRKDGKDILARFALGEVVSSVSPPQLSGKAVMIHTGTSAGQWTNWTTMINRLSANSRRNKIIVGYAKKDLKAGHNLILVTERRKQCEVLAKMFKDEGIKAEILYGNIDNRKGLIEKIRAGKVPVTVATRKIVRFGLNIPPWSAYYCLSPTNNPPNFYQEMSRVRTPHKGKKKPLVRYFVDGFSAAYSCARTCEKVLVEQKFKILREDIDDKVARDIAKRKRANKKTKETIRGWNKFINM